MVSKNLLRTLTFGVLIALFAFNHATVRLTGANAQSSQSASARINNDFLAGMEIISKKYVEEAKYEDLTKYSVNGMLKVLDPHSNYFDRKSFEEMRNEQRSHYYGIGAVIRPANGQVHIIEPYEGTPAARAGLRWGDTIVEINGESTEGWSSDKVRNNLRGEQGTTVKVKVRRAGVAEPVAVSIQRDSVAMPSISDAYMIRQGIGYVNLQERGFHSTTADELTSAIAYLREQGMETLIIDLRWNPGGFLDQAIKVCDKFLQRGQTILSVRGRENRFPDRDLQAESGSPDTMPLVVMINGGSASASEIVAGAIQDHDRGLIVGENSFGKGLVQTIFPLYGGAGLTLTTARYYTPSGRLIQRDYSNGSIYEYIFKRNKGETVAPEKPRGEEKQTDLGRKVFGGGGIEPDIKVADSTGFSGAQGILYHGMMMFTRELAGGQIAGAENFKLNGPQFNHRLKPNEYMITDDTLKAYREYMYKFIVDNPKYGLTKQSVDDNLTWARKQIRYEILLAAYGRNIAQRAQVDLDAQLQRAIAELPNAAQLAEKARRTRTSLRNN